MRTREWALVVFVLLTGWTAVALTAETEAETAADETLRVEQTRLEAGEDLSSRARRALFRARSRQDAGDFAAAVELMTRWLDGDPSRDHHLLRFNLAVSYLGLERPGAALINLERAVVLAPRYARAWLRLGEAAYELQKYKRAGEAFVQAYDLSPDHRPEILYYAGVSLLSGDEAARALDSLTRLIDTHPAAAEVDWYRALAAAAVAAGRPQRAVAYLDKLLVARPDDSAVWDLAYRFHAGQSDYETAATMLTIADYLATLDRDELVRLADLYAAIGVPLQAARYYERAFGGEAEPGPDGYRKWATAWLSAHEVDQARAVLKVALVTQPTRALWSLRGDLEYMAEDYAAALAAFRSGTELDPEFGRGHLMMGYCALELGEEDQARGFLQRAAAFPNQKATAEVLLLKLAGR